MKVNYFGYFLKHRKEKREKLFDIRKFLKGFAKCSNTALKRSFKQPNGENLYLIHMIGDTFLFLGTKSDEIIKKIDTKNLSLGELNSLLTESEKVGFASYLIFKENFFGYGSTMLAPKINRFIDFVNKLLEHSSHKEWEFCVEVLVSQSNYQEALKIPYLSKTTIQFDKDNRLGHKILVGMGLNPDSVHTLGDMEIVFKPREKGGNIKEVIDPLINSDFSKNFNKFLIRAKDEVNSVLTDLYIVGNGAVCDFVKTEEEPKIPDILEERIKTNPELMEKIEKYVERSSFQVEIDLDSLNLFDNSNSWNSLTMDN